MSELATEDWIRKRWGYPIRSLARNENFSLCFIDGTLTLEHEKDMRADVMLLFENATQQNVIDVERIFGIEIE